MTGIPPSDPNKKYQGKGIKGLQDQILELSDRVYHLSKAVNTIYDILTQNFEGEYDTQCHRSIDDSGDTPQYSSTNFKSNKWESVRGSSPPSSIKGIHEKIDLLEEKIDYQLCSWENEATVIECRELSPSLEEIRDVLQNALQNAVDGISQFLDPGTFNQVFEILLDKIIINFVNYIVDFIPSETFGLAPYKSSTISYKGIAELLQIMAHQQKENRKDICWIVNEIRKDNNREAQQQDNEPICCAVESFEPYSEFVFQNQMELIFGTDFPTQKGRLFRFNIPNFYLPPNQISWEEQFSNISFVKGNYYARVIWTDSGIRSGAYVADEKEADKLLNIIESFSSSTPKARRISRNTNYNPTYTGIVKLVRAVLKIPSDDGSVDLYCFYPPER